MKRFILSFIIFYYVFCTAQQNVETFMIQNANDYITSKYQTYDIVILGESHWIKDEVNFLKHNIPLLYNAGVRCFAFEFLAFTAQDNIDKLINSDKFSKSLRDSIISETSIWFIIEYMDILYVLWKLNKSNEEKIKVLGLNYPEKFQITIDRDSTMAKNIIKHYTETNEKMLIYCGANHGFTKFKMCNSDGDFMRMGNIVYEQFPDKVTNIRFFPLRQTVLILLANLTEPQ